MRCRPEIDHRQLQIVAYKSVLKHIMGEYKNEKLINTLYHIADVVGLTINIFNNITAREIERLLDVDTGFHSSMGILLIFLFYIHINVSLIKPFLYFFHDYVIVNNLW